MIGVPLQVSYPDCKVRGANMGPTWVLSAPDGLYVGPMNLAIRYMPVFVLCEGTAFRSVEQRCPKTTLSCTCCSQWVRGQSIKVAVTCRNYFWCDILISTDRDRLTALQSRTANGNWGKTLTSATTLGAFPQTSRGGSGWYLSAQKMNI